MNEMVTIELPVHVRRRANGRRELRAGNAPPAPTPPGGRVPRVARLLALAIKIDDLIRRGEIADYAEAARLGHVTRARMSQIMNMLNLAPDIQEAILLLPSTIVDMDEFGERKLRLITRQHDWHEQRNCAAQPLAEPDAARRAVYLEASATN